MVVSVLLGGATDSQFSAVGYCWQLVNCLFTAAYALYLSKVGGRGGGARGLAQRWGGEGGGERGSGAKVGRGRGRARSRAPQAVG